VESLKNLKLLAKTRLFLGILLSFSLFLLSFISFFSSGDLKIQFQVLAATEKDIAPNITAIIPIWDTTPPSVPILISPSNGSFLNYTPPTFIWQASIDAFQAQNPDYGMNHYVFYLNGSDVFGEIPLVSTETSDYSLVYDPILQQYSLTPKININDASYTWKVRAVDSFDNYSESVTWTFTIDTQAPYFVLNQLGSANVSISAQDLSTIPDSPIKLTENKPTLKAVGEPNSIVQVTVIIPNQSNLVFNASIDSNGDWILTLPILPRDVVIGLNFLITDQAGHLSLLETVEFTIETQVIIIPVPSLPPDPSPTPSPSATPEPSSTPDATPTPPDGTPTPPSSPAPSPPPSPSPQIPRIVIPVIPPEEIVHKIITEVARYVPLEIADVVKNIYDVVSKPVSQATPFAGLLISAFVPALAAVAVATQFGGQLSLLILLRLLQALGLLPKGNPQGIVFDSHTNEPVAFALISVYKIMNNQAELIETVVSSVNGVYSGIELPAGTYQVVVSHLDYDFPSAKGKSKLVSNLDFYKGEQFTVTETQNRIILLIPMDPKQPNSAPKSSKRVRVQLAKLARFSGRLTIPLFIISGVVASIFPSIWNIVIFVIYSLLVSKRVLTWFKTPIITGVVVEKHSGSPVENAVIRLTSPKQNNLMSLVQTNKLGEFRFFGHKDKYLINIFHQDYAWVSEDNNPLSLHEVLADKEAVHIVATMTAYQEMYHELFA
jgi:5-hydroxyisourate hydrolase-like protein (transthyretin family)